MVRAKVSDKNRVAAFFNGLAQDYYRKRYACQQDINSYSMLNRVYKTTQLLDRYATPPGRLLDLGCGPANIFEVIHQRGYDYYGIDISANMIRQAQKRLAELDPQTPVTLITGDVCHTGFPNDYFDVAVALGLMDYLSQETTFYRELRRILRPGGVAFLSYCHKSSYFNFARQLLKPLSQLLHTKDRALGALTTRAHLPSQEKDRLTRVGFDILEAVFLGAHLIPFNLSMPRFYFKLLDHLEHLYQRTGCYFALSSFILVIKKPVLKTVGFSTR